VPTLHGPAGEIAERERHGGARHRLSGSIQLLDRQSVQLGGDASARTDSPAAVSIGDRLADRFPVDPEPHPGRCRRVPADGNMPEFVVIDAVDGERRLATSGYRLLQYHRGPALARNPERERLRAGVRSVAGDVLAALGNHDQHVFGRA
jgi:hypothetical protein